MLQFRTPSAAVLAFLLGGTTARADDETASLKREVVLLRQLNESQKKEIEQLKKEIEGLKKGAEQAKEKPAERAGTLSDLLPAGQVLSGDFRLTTGDKAAGTVAVTIDKRDGTKFEGSSVITFPGKAAGAATPFVGTIKGTTIEFNSPAGTVNKFSMRGEVVENGGLALNYQDSQNRRAKVALKLPK